MAPPDREALRDGSILEIEHLGPGEGRGTGPSQLELFAFMAQPFAPWFSPAETDGLARCIAGGSGTTFSDHFFVGRREGSLVGAVWHGAAADRPEVAVFGFVWTDPAARGLGIARSLSRRSIARFWADGGRASYLGTSDGTARRVYEDAGYRPYHGAVMRALRPGTAPDDHDAWWFRPDETAVAREAAFADVAAYTALLTLPEPTTWRVRDFTERLFVIPPDQPLASCTRPFLSTLVRSEGSPSNVFRVAVVSSGAIVAAVAVSASGTGPSAGNAVLEVHAHPAHRSAALTLVAECLGLARARGVREIRAYADPGDRLEFFLAAGFGVESTMHGYLRSNAGPLDVLVLRRDA